MRQAMATLVSRRVVKDSESHHTDAVLRRLAADDSPYSTLPSKWTASKSLVRQEVRSLPSFVPPFVFLRQESSISTRPTHHDVLTILSPTASKNPHIPVPDG